jgi:hypothetical protein
MKMAKPFDARCHPHQSKSKYYKVHLLQKHLALQKGALQIKGQQEIAF